MKKIYVRLNTTGKIYSYESRDAEGKSLRAKPNQTVLIDTDQIIEEGTVVEKPETMAEFEEGAGQILRLVTAEDRHWHCQLKQFARQFIEEAQNKVIRHGLDMKILDADFSFDQKKLTLYFSAKGRVDFRGLVLDMAKSFDKLIRLQQVGARDEAKYFGGIGKCGRELCCAKFLNNIETITLEMAQAQELSTAGTSKLSGCCGRLMCCLSFEAENYPSSGGRRVEADPKKVYIERPEGAK